MNKPRTLQGEIAALEREINQHRRDMAEIELDGGRQEVLDDAARRLAVGRRDHVRKAYVTLAAGQELNFGGEAV